MLYRKYYEAYEERYHQIHERNLQWFHNNPSPIVEETMDAFFIGPVHKVLEIGCGEGRDAFAMLDQGYDLLATDVSPEAIRFCQSQRPDLAKHFQVLDCVGGNHEGKYDFIYAVAVVHMLVTEEDRNAFYSFVREHLRPDGIALICTMGDGIMERQTDIGTAFDIQERIHEQTGKPVRVVSTSCRMVSFPTFEKELKSNRLAIIHQGLTSVEPDFPQMMYAVVRTEL